MILFIFKQFQTIFVSIFVYFNVDEIMVRQICFVRPQHKFLNIAIGQPVGFNEGSCRLNLFLL